MELKAKNGDTSGERRIKGSRCWEESQENIRNLSSPLCLKSREQTSLTFVEAERNTSKCLSNMSWRGGKRSEEKKVIESHSSSGKRNGKDRHLENIATQAVSQGRTGKKAEKTFVTMPHQGCVSSKKKVTVRGSVSKSDEKKIKEKEDGKKAALTKTKTQSKNNTPSQVFSGRSYSLTLPAPEDSYMVSCALLEMALERCAMLDSLFSIMDRMILAVPVAKTEEENLAILDEFMYRWMTQDRSPRYDDRFTVGDKRMRREMLQGYYNQRRSEHRRFLEKIAGSSVQSSFNDDLKERTSFFLFSSDNSNTLAKPLHGKSGLQRCLPRLNEDQSTLAAELWIDTWLKNESKNQEKICSVQCSQLEFLTSRVVRMSPVVDWSLREIALFQLTLCNYGPNFYVISKHIGSKSYKEAYSFYAEVFKQTLRYKIFKEFKIYTQWWHGLQ